MEEYYFVHDACGEAFKEGHITFIAPVLIQHIADCDGSASFSVLPESEAM